MEDESIAKEQLIKEVDLAFIELLGKKGPRLAYIPSQSDLQKK
ncbi:unnamed protein product, partial [marine sediment metagenome]